MYVYNPVMCEYAHDDFYFSGIGGGVGAVLLILSESYNVQSVYILFSVQILTEINTFKSNEFGKLYIWYEFKALKIKPKKLVIC